jgi:hypothetical protein
MNLAAGFVERFEEPEPLDMVHVEMGQQQVDAPRPIVHRGSQPP